MTTLKTIFFILLVPGFLLGVVLIFVSPKIPGLALPLGPWNWAAIPFWIAGSRAGGTPSDRQQTG